MSLRISPRLFLALLWALLTFVSLFMRPLFPIDETRYAAVAWEMWCRDDFLVPYLNGETYSHKPPLLFWLMQLSWWLFGVNDWSIRVIAPLFSLASLYLSAAVANELWPDRKDIAVLTPYILLGSFFWMIYGTLTMFDIMLSFFALLGIYALSIMIRKGVSFNRSLLLGLAIGGGVLSKGPVILLHILPLALSAPWLLKPLAFGLNRKQWYLGLLLAILIGAVLALSWAIPAGLAGGEVYRNAIFLGQTSGRIVDSFAHKLPWWWYFELLPVILLPWILFKPLWTGLAKLNTHDFGCRFCLLWAVPVFIAFSLVSGKRIHYLLPLLPAVALLFAWALTQNSKVNWRPYLIGVTLFYGMLGLILSCLPWLNTLYSWKVELNLLSPFWGLVMVLIAVFLAIKKNISTEEFVRNVCVAGIALALLLAGGYFQIQGFRYDTKPPAQKIAELMTENRVIAFFGSKYHGQFHFAGRLTQPIKVISNREGLIDFANSHLTGFVLVEYKESPEIPETIMRYHFAFKNHTIGFIACQSLIDHPQIVSKLTPA